MDGKSETATQFSHFYGEKYVTSNVQILNNATGEFEYIGQQYRYFTTAHGLRIMAFGVLYDFTGNTNYTKVIKAATMVQQPWFLSAVNSSAPIDLFLLLGHNPVRGSGSTLTTVYNKIRSMRPDVPIQVFGGHTHIRDFAVYDTMTTALESGRYCETLGWLSMSGIKSSNYTGLQNPRGVPNPTTPAVKISSATATASAVAPTGTGTSNSSLRYSRRYIDWNRLSFAYHAVGSQDYAAFDYHSGLRVSSEITTDRQALNLSALYGCAPQTWCISCAPFLSNGSIFSLLQTALSDTIVTEARAAIPRLVIINTGSVRFDLVQGPFTFDDSFIVSPFTDGFQYIPDVPYNLASQVVGILDNGPYEKKRDLRTSDFNFHTFTGADSCVDDISYESLSHTHSDLKPRSLFRRQAPPATLTPGYVTKDDFGSDGDDTAHTAIPYYSVPNDLQANASFPTNGSLPSNVDLIFLDFIASDVVSALKGIGGNYTSSDVSYYLPSSFTTNSYLPEYAQKYWSKGPCSVGQPVG
ncbi:MAG: hypothetical protein Q9227_000418 [Pyrenula ochraceoflavens]